MVAQLEHVNFTVKDATSTADLFARVFGWHKRWEGDSIHGGRSIHLGEETTYLAIYEPPRQNSADAGTHFTTGALNHIGVLVPDIDATEKRIRAEGIETFNHGDYEPGRRFYFEDPNGIEIEVVSYD